MGSKFRRREESEPNGAILFLATTCRRKKGKREGAFYSSSVSPLRLEKKKGPGRAVAPNVLRQKKRKRKEGIADLHVLSSGPSVSSPAVGSDNAAIKAQRKKRGSDLCYGKRGKKIPIAAANTQGER